MRCLLDKVTAGTTLNRDVLGMHVIATSDQPMINQWDAHQTAIQERLSNMQRNLALPYNRASLPTVERPEHITI